MSELCVCACVCVSIHVGVSEYDVKCSEEVKK